MDAREIRRLNLIYAIKVAGDSKNLADAIGRSRKYIDQIVQGFQGVKDKQPRTLGDVVAGEIAEKVLGQPVYWMSIPHPELWDSVETPLVTHTVGALWPFSVPYPQYETLGDVDKARLDGMVSGFFAGLPQTRSKAA